MDMARNTIDQVARYADMMAAMGAEPRLRIMRLLLSAHPGGMVVGEIHHELDIPGSTLSHHLEKLKNEELVNVRREGTFLRYSANSKALKELLAFLYAECCSRNKAVEPEFMTRLCKRCERGDASTAEHATRRCERSASLASLFTRPRETRGKTPREATETVENT